MSATAASKQPIMESVYVDETVQCTLIQWYSSTACRTSSWDGGDWTCDTDNSCPFGSLSADWTRCCTAQLRPQILRMQIQKLVLGPTFGAHIQLSNLMIRA